jgi:hypothetical protein
MADTQRANTAALSELGFKAIGTCAVHLIKQNLQAYTRDDLNEKKNKSTILLDVDHLRLLPPEFFDRGWKAVRQKWKALQEDTLLEKFEEEHVQKNCGWMCGFHAIGLATQNNSLESDNKYGVRGILKRELDKTMVYPSGGPGLIPGITCFFDRVIPTMSRDAKCNLFEVNFEIKEGDEKEAEEFLSNRWYLDLENGVHCFRQVRHKGPVTVLTHEDCKKAASLFRKKEWTPEEFDCITTTVFTTNNCCFSCLDFAQMDGATIRSLFV